jgi:thymidylate synthase (FAD)
MDPHAQEEIRWYARAMHDLVQPLVPITMEAWKDYATEGGAVGGVKLTRLEVKAMRAEIEALKAGRTAPTTLSTDNKREQAEWDAKRVRLGF